MIAGRNMMLAAAVAGIGIATTSQADTIVTWGSVSNITGPGSTTVVTTGVGGNPNTPNPSTITNGTNDVLTAGTQVFGMNYSGAPFVSWPYDVNINSQVFNSYRDGGNSSSVTLGSITYTATGITNVGPYFPGQGGAGQSYGGLATNNCCGGNPNPDYTLDNSAYSNDQNGTIKFSGLTPGDTYKMQFWVEDPRSCCSGRSETLTSGTATSGALSYGTTNAPDGQWVVGTFVADAGASQTFTLLGSPNPSNPSDTVGSAQVNLIQLRDLGVVTPEPASLSLIGIGGLGLLARRRRA